MARPARNVLAAGQKEFSPVARTPNVVQTATRETGGRLGNHSQHIASIETIHVTPGESQEPFRVAASEALPRLTAGEAQRCSREDLEGAAWRAVGVDRSGGDHQHPGIVHLGFTGGATSDLTADAVRAAEPTRGGGDRPAADSVPDVLSERRMDGEQGNSRSP